MANESIDFFASGHPLVEGIFAHYEDSSPGSRRAVRDQDGHRDRRGDRRDLQGRPRLRGGGDRRGRQRATGLGRGGLAAADHRPARHSARPRRIRIGGAWFAGSALNSTRPVVSMRSRRLRFVRCRRSADDERFALFSACFLRLSRSICYSKMFSTSGNNSVVECDLAKVEVAGSNPVSRSNLRSGSMRRLSTVARSEFRRATVDLTDEPELRLGEPTDHAAIDRDDTRDRILRLIIPF